MKGKQVFVVGIARAGTVETRVVGSFTPAEAREIAEKLIDQADAVEPVRLLKAQAPEPFDFAALLGYRMGA